MAGRRRERGVVRRRRPQRVHPPGVDAARPAGGCLRRSPPHRDREHGVRPQPVQRAPRRGRRARQARRLGGGWRPARPPGDVARRDAGPPDRDALAEPRGHGHRGAAPRQPHRRRRPPRRVRQDDPVAADGGRLGRPTGHGGPGRADAHRHLPGASARVRHRRLAAQRGGPGRDALGGRVPRVRVVDDPQPRPLQHHGDRVDDGLRRRGARDDHPRDRRHAGPGQPAARACARGGPPRGRRWSTRTGDRARC